LTDSRHCPECGAGLKLDFVDGSIRSVSCSKCEYRVGPHPDILPVWKPEDLHIMDCPNCGGSGKVSYPK